MINRTLIFIAVIILSSSCAQLVSFHGARTEGAGNLSVSPGVEGIGLIQSPAGGELGSQVLPVAKLEASYGITNNLDVIASASSSLSLLTSLKFKVMGSNETPFALSLMPGYEFQTSPNGGSASISRFHIPVIASLYSSENTGFFLAPKYVIQVEEGGDNYSFPGFSAGVIINRRIKYHIGGGVFVPINTLAVSDGIIYQFGINARIPITFR